MAKRAQHPYRSFMREVLAPRFWLFYYIAAAIASSQIAFRINATVGVYATFAALVICLVLAIRYQFARTLAISVAIIPLASIIAMCIPQTSAFGQAVVFYDAILILALVYRFMFTLTEPRHTDTSLRPSEYVKALPTLLILGQLIGGSAYLLLSQGHYDYAGTAFGIVVGAAILFAIAEEMLFRGLVQSQGRTVFHPVMGAILSTTLGVVLSIGQGVWQASLVALISGAVLAAVYHRKPNLLLTIVLNASAKIVYVLLLANFAWGYFR
jgi:membrane protease YdiL (CAAX protease family)